jgi:hypothetical protein
MATSYVCEFCGKVLSTQSNLRQHTRTAKYCLKLRKKEVVNRYKCEHCEYSTGLNCDIKKHILRCKGKKDYDKIQLEDLKLRLATNAIELAVSKATVKIYKDEVIPLLKKGTTNVINNNITFNTQMNYCQKVLSPYKTFSSDMGRLVWTHYRDSYFTRGVDGMIVLINKIISAEEDKKYLISFENSKRSFWRNNDNKLEVDDKADKFLNEVFPYMKEVTNEKYKEEIADTDLSDIKRMQEMLDMRNSIYRIGELGSCERKKCVDAMANNLYVSNNMLKMSLPVAGLLC